MIQQVRDIAKVSEEWYLTKDQRIELYIQCAQALDNEGDSNGSFKVYFQAFKLINTLSAKEAKQQKSSAENFVLCALKSPGVINLEEILLLDAVQDLKESSKEIFNLVDLVVSSDMAKFKKELDSYNKLMEQHKVSKQMVQEKKRFVQICSINIESSTGNKMTFKEVAKMLDLKEDDVEEWAITAINNDIIDARIDQIEESIVIKTHKLRQLSNDEWNKVKAKVTTWRERFESIEQVLQH